MSTIHFIGGEKGGVGKSVVARLLAQYCIDHATPFVAVDADASHTSLRRFYGDYTRTVDLTRVESVDEIMGLATEADRRVLVDLPAQSERALSAWIKGAGIFELARECGVSIVFWHVMDDGKDSLTALERLLDRHGAAARYCIVKNFGRGKDFSLFESSPVRARALAMGASVVELPELQETAMRKIDRFDASYWAAAHNSVVGADAFTRMDRQRVKVWLQTWFAEVACLADVV
ncbi:MAG TPA: hypothetical protein VN894_08205 [Polyangiaceae bacterium]|nr:hypothetical protein [Polyangiaceae bacterium]